MFVSRLGTILHADLDAFFASVEQRDNPRLRGRPAWGDGGPRRLCPQVIVAEPRMSAYAEASKAVFRVFEDTTPLVEGLSIDEAFLDVRGMRRLSGSPAEIAR